MSFTGKAAFVLMKWMSGKPAASAQELLDQAGKYNAKNKFVKPSDRKADYRVEKIAADQDLLIVRSNKRADCTNCAVLFIFGAGGTMNAWKPHLMMIRNIVNQTGAEVFMPLYPLCTDAPVSASVETAYAAYQRILKEYAPEQIAITGDSSGGACCLSLISMINQLGELEKMPKLAILHSPSGVPHNEDAWKRMEEQSRKDAPGTMAMVKFFPEICRHGEDVSVNMIYPALGDYRNAPETYIYYGAEETLASLGKDIEDAYTAAGSTVHIHYEPGMIHCYSSFPAFPESRKACREWLQEIRNLQQPQERHVHPE